MPGTLAVLTVTLADYNRLTQILGNDAAIRHLADFSDGLDNLFSSLLAAHKVIGCYRRDRQGRWAVCFRILSGDQPQAVRLACMAIEERGRRLMQELLVSVFGDAMASRLPAALFISVMPPDTDLEEIWSSWVSWAKEKQILLSPGPLGLPLGRPGTLSAPVRPLDFGPAS